MLRNIVYTILFKWQSIEILTANQNLQSATADMNVKG